jgi:hypothetical protein
MGELTRKSGGGARLPGERQSMPETLPDQPARAEHLRWNRATRAEALVAVDIQWLLCGLQECAIRLRQVTGPRREVDQRVVRVGELVDTAHGGQLTKSRVSDGCGRRGDEVRGVEDRIGPDRIVHVHLEVVDHWGDWFGQRQGGVAAAERDQGA